MQSDTINQTNQINQINQEVQMAAESASYSRKIDVWRRQERDDGSVIENIGIYAKMTEFEGFDENLDFLW